MTHSTITSKGQTTVPASVRRALGLEAGDRIVYEIQGDSVVIRVQPEAMEVFGSLKPPAAKAGGSFAEEREQSRRLWTKEAAREGSE